MPEGLDQAADAFRNEIAPGSSRPRDDGGRFAAINARPEPLFQDRPLEGDPKTGDTRDAGEDARLAAIERRVADGRSEEGDAAQLERLSDDAQGARRAPGEEQHKPGENEQGQQDGEGGPEGEQDAEAARWALTLDGKAVDKVEVDVAGEKKQVSLPDLMRGYVEGEALAQRDRAFQERAQQWEGATQKVAQEIGATREEYLKRLAYAGRLIADLTPKELDWDREYAADPRAAHEKEKVYAHVRGRMQQIALEMQREDQERGQAEARNREEAARREAEYANWGIQEFRRKSGITDQATLNNEFSAMRRAGQEYGFTEHELATVYDPRMLAVLHDASKYRRATANKPRPVAPDQGRTLAPGAAPRIGNATRKGIDDALKTQARSGGSIDATAAVFEKLLR